MSVVVAEPHCSKDRTMVPTRHGDMGSECTAPPQNTLPGAKEVRVLCDMPVNGCSLG